jgi:hypothetical protein
MSDFMAHLHREKEKGYRNFNESNSENYANTVLNISQYLGIAQQIAGTSFGDFLHTPYGTISESG